MSTRTIEAAPVRKSIRVRAAQARAFEVFTARFDAWWPKSHHIGKAAMKEAVIETCVGGRWYEKDEDGAECEWGRVLAYDPPARIVLSWHINSKFVLDATVASEVEVRFIPDGAEGTLVELEHRIIASDADAIRAAVDSPGGWGALLELFGQSAASD